MKDSIAMEKIIDNFSVGTALRVSPHFITIRISVSSISGINTNLTSQQAFLHYTQSPHNPFWSRQQPCLG